jgi:membrane protein implicated in regulation of membrane protease activity
MTVFVLAILWLIVIVPMILRRSDERRREQSVAGFGAAMRVLGRRTSDAAEREVFVPSRNRAQRDASLDRGARRPDSSQRRANVPVRVARRPIPSAQEALMLPVDRSEMSAARRHMMARRRRALLVLFAGTALFTLVGFVMGGVMWLLAAAFAASLVGYFYFLRAQAMKDRARRSNRLRRATDRRDSSYDVTEDVARFEEPPASMVRIDDDDIELQSLDTIDLTGVYEEELATSAVAVQRRAS